MKTVDFLKSVAERFVIYGSYRSAAPYGTGHINDTYCLRYDQAGTAVRYILQRINRSIFADIPRLMENVERVCTHTRQNVANTGQMQASRRTLTLVPTRQGQAVHVDEDGQYWRVYLFIENATGYDRVRTVNQAYEAAKAFARFQGRLVDLPGGPLHDTIPHFHDTRRRFADLEQAAAGAPPEKLDACRTEIDWAVQQRQLAEGLLLPFEKGLLPERVTHNDTKLNNVLIDDASQQALCVIDLDTVMPGLSLYDFGDLVRSSTSPAPEDERDLCRCFMQLPFYEALTRGYLEAGKSFLTDAEIACMPIAAQVLTYECGIRFLTDFLQGDRYFKTSRPGQNLARCRAQFALLASMQKQQADMEACARKLLREIKPLGSESGRCQ